MKTLSTTTLIALVFGLAFSTACFAETRTTPVEVENAPTVEISQTNNLVTTQAKSLKVSPLTTAVTIAAGTAAYIPDVSCVGYKEARIVIYSNVAYTVAQDLTVWTYYDSVALGTTPWWSLTVDINQYGLSPICTSFSQILPVMGNTLKIKISNGSASSVTIDPSKCWVYLVN